MDKHLNFSTYKLFDKKVLSEEFVIVHQLSKKLLIDYNIILDHFKKSKKQNLRVRPEHWYSDNNYYKLDALQHITWLVDYIRDNYRYECEQRIKINSLSGIYLNYNESIGSHHHINDWDYEESPDMSLVFCLDPGDKPCEIIFEHEYGRHKKRRYAVTFKKGRFVMFPSYLRHSITQNKNKKPFVGLSMRWQNAYPGE